MVSQKNWQQINQEEAYKLSMAEFKGATLQALKDVKDSVDKLERKQQDLQSQMNNQRLIAAVLGGIAGIIAALVSPLKPS